MIEAKDYFGDEKKEASSLLLDEVKNDKSIIDELTKLGVSEKEIPFYVNLLFDYKCQKDQCASCPGEEKCNSDNKGSYMSLMIGDSGKLTYSLGPCPERMKMEMIKASYLYRDFDEELLKVVGRKKGKNKKSTYTELVKCVTSESYKWGYVSGEAGSGKTNQVIGICNDFAKNGLPVAYLNFPQRSEEMKNMAMKERDSFTRMVARLNSCTVLVLDDFGDEYKSDYLIDVVLLPMLLERARKKKITYFVSAYSLDDLSQLYISSSKAKANAKRLIDLIKKNIEHEIIVTPSVENILN